MARKVPEQKLPAEHRVVHLTTVHSASDPRIFHKEVKSLQGEGYDVHLVAPAERSGVVDGVPVITLPRAANRLQRLGLQHHAYRAARRLNADVYHIHDPELIPVAYVLKGATGARVIYDMHEDYRWHGPVEGRLIRLFERWCFGWVDHVVLAEQGYRSIMEGETVPCTVIENYFKPPEAGRGGVANAGDRPLHLLYAGVVGEMRGLSTMLELTERLNQSGTSWSLRVVGACYKPGERAAALDAISSMDADVTWVGRGRYVPFEDMLTHYRWADVGIALYAPDPNYVQSYPTKFYEYLHYGLPILCSDFPLWRAFVEKHSCGAVVAPGNVDAAVRVLRWWSDNPDEYRALSEAARVAANHYRWESMGKRLVALYDTMLAGESVTG